MEASVVLSGTFMQRHTFCRSHALVLEYTWLKESCFRQVPWTSCRNQWWHLWDLRTLWWWSLLWRVPSLFDLSSCWWVPARATWTTVKAAAPWVLWWPTGWALWRTISLTYYLLGAGGLKRSMFPPWQVFCLEAFLAQTDKDLTNAIADFMDCSIVIPPTVIQDQEMLKPIISFQKRMLRDRVRPIDSRLAFGEMARSQYTVLYLQRTTPYILFLIPIYWIVGWKRF